MISDIFTLLTTKISVL